MTTPALDQFAGLADEIDDTMIALRHDLHAHPELSFDEGRTTNVIRERLGQLGWELRPCGTETGAVARLVGARPGRRVMLRADIDALPVEEEASVPFASLTPGVMHACGHDVHTASLLGVAEILAKSRAELPGEYVLVFQPAEEVIGGATRMIAGGLFAENPVDAVVGAHVTSLAPVGVIMTRPGVLMSRGASITARLAGRAGHGAFPTTQGNVILAVSQLASRLNEVVEGLLYDDTSAVCSAGVLRAGTKNNVVPREATLAGTLRTFTEDQYLEATSRLRHLCDEVASTFEVTIELDIDDGTPAVVNDPGVTEVVVECAAAIVGPTNVLAMAPVTASDDVAELLARVPGCYFFVGGALADGTSGMHHSPDFTIDDDALRVQAAVLAASALRLASA